MIIVFWVFLSLDDMFLTIYCMNVSVLMSLVYDVASDNNKDRIFF